jgi:hypothetical protein
MSRPTQPTVARAPGQGYWDRLRQIDAILAKRDRTSVAQRALISQWLTEDPRSAAPNGRK